MRFSLRTLTTRTYAAAVTVALLIGMALGPIVTYAQSNTIAAAAAGTLTTSNPLSGAQTWNAAGVSFVGLQLAFTETASAAGSQYLTVLGGAAGTTQEYAVGKGGTTTQLGAETIAATTSQLILGTTNTTTLNFPAPAASTTLTGPNIGPSNAASLGAFFDCGSTGSGNQTCSPAAAGGTYHIVAGHSTLSADAATITFPAGTTFTSTTSYECVANDITTRANPVQMIPASSSTATITNTTGATDVIQWLCAGL